MKYKSTNQIAQEQHSVKVLLGLFPPPSKNCKEEDKELRAERSPLASILQASISSPLKSSPPVLSDNVKEEQNG